MKAFAKHILGLLFGCRVLGLLVLCWPSFSTWVEARGAASRVASCMRECLKATSLMIMDLCLYAVVCLCLLCRFSSNAAVEDTDVQFRVWAIKSAVKRLPLCVQVGPGAQRQDHCMSPACTGLASCRVMVCRTAQQDCSVDLHIVLCTILPLLAPLGLLLLAGCQQCCPAPQ